MPAVAAAATIEVEQQASDAPSPDEQLYAMTISGGVSLGAYEAGLNWAVVEFMRNPTVRQSPRLLGVTGASAGSINALLTAIRWCETRKASTVDDNLFARTWLPVGFDTLLPGSSGAYYGDGEEWPQDLLLSRKNAFAAILRQVGDALEKEAYRDCNLKLGFTVTSKSPRVLPLRGLRVGNQRFVVPLVTASKNGRIRFAVDAGMVQNERVDLLGNLLFLAPSARDEDGAYVVAHKDVIRAALASSAYPMAFGPVDLSYCAPSAECPAAERDRDATKNALCGELSQKLAMTDGVACRRKFIDGGVFDNVPLGVAMAQIESNLPSGRTPATHRPLRYIYMYPGNRREPTAARRPAEPPDAPGAPRPATPIGDTLDFLSGAIGTASEYELHNVLRYNLWNAGTPQLAVAVADLLASQTIYREPVWTAKQDVDRAGTLASLVAARPMNRARVASALRAASRVLERVASQEAARSVELQASSLVAYADLRQTVLAAVIAVCGNGSGTAHAASGTCGSSGRELLIQARELQNDVRNERHLMLSRRFSPITGTHIAHFGAFLDRPFRDYDYHAGVYDALWSVAEMSCEIRQAQVEGVRNEEVQQSPVQKAPEPAPAGREDPATCRRAAFEDARERLGIRPGSTAHAITERLWRAEHEDLVPARGETAIDRTMTALFDAARCAEGADRPREKMCLRDLDLAALARALDRAGYQAGRDAPFVRWVMDHPEGGWWALPGVFAAGRLLELARAEGMGKLSTGAALAETYLESYVDQHSTSVFVAPSSLPDRGMTRWAGLLFPFAAMSLHPTRRFELGLLRGGIRVGPKADVSGLEMLLPWDLLAELSARVTVRDRRVDEDDQGYGLFTRGSTTLHASFAPTLRMGGILWSLGFRAGVPVPVGALESQIPFKDQVNTEVVATFLGDKLRLAVGCNPLQDSPGDDCWRDVYYSFGVNDLAGLVYWTGLNPYKLERLFVPFAAVRVTTGEPSGEIGLVRGGWQPWRFVGIWADASLVVGSETTGNASVAYEADIGTWLRRVGLRGGYPLSIRDDARIEASSLELVLTFAHGIRVAAGALPFDVADDDIDWMDASYVSLGWDPGSLLLTTVRALR